MDLGMDCRHTVLMAAGKMDAVAQVRTNRRVHKRFKALVASLELSEVARWDGGKPTMEAVTTGLWHWLSQMPVDQAEAMMGRLLGDLEAHFREQAGQPQSASGLTGRQQSASGQSARSQSASGQSARPRKPLTPLDEGVQLPPPSAPASADQPKGRDERPDPAKPPRRVK